MSGESSLDAFFGSRPDETPLGMVVGGSLSSGLLVRLDARLSIERLAVGRYIVIQGTSGRKFFGLITDIALDSTNPDLMRQPPAPGDAFAAEVYARQVAYGTLSVSPMLMLDPEDDQPRPNKTVPAHFAPVHEASAEDVERVFGAEDEKHLFLGTPLDMEAVHVNLDLDRFVERSSGVFGKSGTGKSFITRILLSGIIRAGRAVSPDLRHAQRLRLGGQGRGRARVQGAAPAVHRRPGVGGHAGRGHLAAPAAARSTACSGSARSRSSRRTSRCSPGCWA